MIIQFRTAEDSTRRAGAAARAPMGHVNGALVVKHGLLRSFFGQNLINLASCISCPGYKFELAPPSSGMRLEILLTIPYFIKLNMEWDHEGPKNILFISQQHPQCGVLVRPDSTASFPQGHSHHHAASVDSGLTLPILRKMGYLTVLTSPRSSPHASANARTVSSSSSSTPLSLAVWYADQDLM